MTEQTPKNKPEKKPDKNSVGAIMGQIIGVIACLCISAIAITLTVKFIMWLI